MLTGTQRLGATTEEQKQQEKRSLFHILLAKFEHA